MTLPTEKAAVSANSNLGTPITGFIASIIHVFQHREGIPYLLYDFKIEVENGFFQSVESQLEPKTP